MRWSTIQPFVRLSVSLSITRVHFSSHKISLFTLNSRPSKEKKTEKKNNEHNMPCCGGDDENRNASDDEFYGKSIIIIVLLFVIELKRIRVVFSM